jgi:uncharacterized protein (TIRG00374 family)
VPLIGLAAFVACIYLYNVNIPEIIATMRQINVSVYALATIATVADVTFSTLAWHSLLRHLRVKISLFKSMVFVWIGIYIDTLIPAESISGDLSKIYLVNREQEGTAGMATASLVAQRLIGMSLNVATLLLGASLLLIESLLYGIMLSLILFLVVVTSTFLVLMLLLSRKEKWTLRIVDAVISLVERVTRGHWKLGRMREEAIEATVAFHAAIKDYGHAPTTLFVATSFSIISWVLSVTGFYFVFLSIGYPQISWSAILVISAIFVAIKSIPIGVPFEIGLPEITLTFLLGLFGVPLLIGATATILMRLLTLWMRFFIGFVAQQWLGITAMATTGSSSQPKPPESGKV